MTEAHEIGAGGPFSARAIAPTRIFAQRVSKSTGLSYEFVTCGGEVVLALLGVEEIADLPDCAPEGVDDPDRPGVEGKLAS